jgi:hypothetical protein
VVVTVLNDVLDFNRMDSGRFESVHKPYAFHQVMKAILVPLKIATDARGLELVTELDRTIDWVRGERPPAMPFADPHCADCEDGGVSSYGP